MLNFIKQIFNSDFRVKAKHLTFNLGENKAFTLSVAENLGLWHPTAITTILLGWGCNKVRADGGTEIRTKCLVILSIKLTYSYLTLRGE